MLPTMLLPRIATLSSGLASALRRGARTSFTGAGAVAFSSSSTSGAASSPATTRGDFAHFERLQTRWNDNDAFGHVNNVIYYFFFDDAVNNHLLDRGVGIELPRFVAESGCR